MEDDYATITLSADLRERIITSMRAAVSDSEATDSLMRASLAAMPP